MTCFYRPALLHVVFQLMVHCFHCVLPVELPLLSDVFQLLLRYFTSSVVHGTFSSWRSGIEPAVRGRCGRINLTYKLPTERPCEASALITEPPCCSTIETSGFWLSDWLLLLKHAAKPRGYCCIYSHLSCQTVCISDHKNIF